MEKFVIEGGVPLSGTIVPAGNKNGALPILAACLLTEDEVILRNVPRISDVEAMVLLLESLGARVQWLGPGEVSVNTGASTSHEVDREPGRTDPGVVPAGGPAAGAVRARARCRRPAAT